MTSPLSEILETVGVAPVLVDVGASGAAPSVWDAIASHSVYVGFDPDLREMHDVPDGRFRRSVIVNQAVTDVPDRREVEFFLTRSPFCSSSLEPDAASLSNYLFRDLFEVERSEKVPAATLNLILAQLELPRVHWLKLDTQGTDLRIYESLDQGSVTQLLAVDVEPGLIDAYKGEDLFVDTHRRLLSSGFWLSNLAVKGAVRMRPDTLQLVQRDNPIVDARLVEAAVRTSPGWCEARYLRTLDSLAGVEHTPADFAVLWVFSILDGQLGFALDVAAAYEERFGRDSLSGQLFSAASARITQSPARWLLAAKSRIPPGVRRRLGRLRP